MDKTLIYLLKILLVKVALTFRGRKSGPKNVTF